jgi:hypothetical protein
VRVQGICVVFKAPSPGLRPASPRGSGKIGKFQSTVNFCAKQAHGALRLGRARALGGGGRPAARSQTRSRARIARRLAGARSS